jgi:hypothetical protein
MVSCAAKVIPYRDTPVHAKVITVRNLMPGMSSGWLFVTRFIPGLIIIYTTILPESNPIFKCLSGYSNS